MIDALFLPLVARNCLSLPNLVFEVSFLLLTFLALHSTFSFRVLQPLRTMVGCVRYCMQCNFRKIKKKRDITSEKNETSSLHFFLFDFDATTEVVAVLQKPKQ